MMHTFTLLAGALMIGVVCCVVNSLRFYAWFFAWLSPRIQPALRTTGLWYHVLGLLGKQILIRVNIRRVQMQLNTQVLQVVVEGHNHTMTTVFQIIVNMYHDRMFDRFTEENFKAGRRNAFIHQHPPTNAINSRTVSSYGRRRESTNIATVSNTRPSDVSKFSALDCIAYADWGSWHTQCIS
jgi:hypothetical protein